MQQPKMIVLGLIAQGMKYGLEMENFVEASKMRLWARIGNSTIYKTLRDLEREGCVSAQAREAKRGPGKTEYSLTEEGVRRLSALVGDALGSRESVYSDRIAGLVFALSLPPGEARQMINGSIAGIGQAIDEIGEEKRARGEQPLAGIVLDFYHQVYRAEQAALKSVREQILGGRRG